MRIQSLFIVWCPLAGTKLWPLFHSRLEKNFIISSNRFSISFPFSSLFHTFMIQIFIFLMLFQPLKISSFCIIFSLCCFSEVFSTSLSFKLFFPLLYLICSFPLIRSLFQLLYFSFVNGSFYISYLYFNGFYLFVKLLTKLIY